MIIIIMMMISGKRLRGWINPPILRHKNRILL
jgi:hypothetical protein